MHPSSRRSTLWLLAWVFAFTTGCDEKADRPAPLASTQAPFASAAPLPLRAEVVAMADALAVEGTRKGGPAGVELLSRAAALRERVFRRERREADALEAVELLRQAGQIAGPDGCRLVLRQTLIEGELRADPAATFRSLYRLSRSTKDSACRKDAENALVALDAFRPSNAELATLESASVAKSASPVASAPAAPATVVAPKLTGAAGEKPRVTNIERYGAKDAARVVVFVTHPTTFRAEEIPPGDGAPARLVVDLDRATYQGKRELGVGGLVERVRIGDQPQGTRVVLDLTSSAHRKVFYLPEPFRLVIDVSKEPPLAFKTGKGGARSVRRVVLDPGHGGHDPGAVGPLGLREKDVALDLAHRAAPLIARELGIATLLTRDSDVFVPLDERTARANAFGADLMISIHCNASEDGEGAGVATFVLDDSRDALSLRIAARENAASQEAAVEVANTLSQLIDRSALDRSLHFAELLQRAAISSLSARYSDVPNLGVRRAGFYVLAGARMPSVLFEASFISNARGESRLNSADYRDKLADAIVNAVRAYREGR
jgi:N-acetylmuramoyl-L-alanine amidase